MRSQPPAGLTLHICGSCVEGKCSCGRDTPGSTGGAGPCTELGLEIQGLRLPPVAAQLQPFLRGVDLAPMSSTAA